METTDDFVEVELPDNEYFHEGVVGLAMDIVADCKMVVETVNGINTEMEPDTTDTTDAIKETFVQAIKRVPQSAARLVDMTHQFIRENAAFYLDDQQYLVRLVPPLFFLCFLFLNHQKKTRCMVANYHFKPHQLRFIYVYLF